MIQDGHIRTISTHEYALVELIDGRTYAGPLVYDWPKTGDAFICILDRADTGDRVCIPFRQVKLVHLLATEESFNKRIRSKSESSLVEPSHEGMPNDE